MLILANFTLVSVIKSDDYQPFSVPIVTTNSSTDVEETTAILNGYLNDGGGENCTVGFEYGNTTGYGNICITPNEHFYAGGAITRKVYRYQTTDMAKVAETAVYGGDINVVIQDEDYVYIGGGGGTNKVYQYWKSNLTKKAEANYGWIIALAQDDTYVYAGGDAPNKIYQYWKSNMTKKAETASYGGLIYALTSDDTYIYAGGFTTQKVYQYWKSNMTKKAETASYGNFIYALAQDEEYVYAGGSDTNKVYQYWKSNMTKKAETANYGSAIYAIEQNLTYIYAGGATQKVYQYWKSNMTKKAETADYGGYIYALAQDTTYVYAGGGTTRKVYQYWKSNMTKKAETADYGGPIYSLSIYEDVFNTDSTFDFNLIGLQPGLLHHYRAFAENSNSTSYGSDAVFLTKPFPPTDLSVNILSNSSLNISWTNTANSTYIERNASGQIVWAFGAGVFLYNGSGTYFVDTDLDRATLYYYQAWSYAEWDVNSTIHQWSETFGSAYSSTESDASIVTTNPATNISSITATLNGYLDDDGGETCDVSFEYGATDLYGNTTESQLKQKGESFNVNVVGLIPETTYHFRAVATNDYGTTYGEDEIFDTLRKIVTPPLYLNGIATSNQINLSWVKSMNSSSGSIELFSEYFTSYPNGWTRSPVVTNWAQRSTSNAGGTSPELRFYYNPRTTNTFRFYSPSIDTTGYTEATLSFKHFFDWYATPFTIKVETSTDSVNWNTVWSYVDPTVNIGPETVSIPLTTGVGSSTFYISFTLIGDSYNMDYWYIDDVLLSVATSTITIGTYIQYDTTGYPTSIDEGINAYNGTGSSTLVTNLTPDAHYFFSAWAWEQGSFNWSEEYATWDGFTSPLPPSNVSADEETPLNITLSWTKGKDEYRTVIEEGVFNLDEISAYTYDAIDGFIADSPYSFAIIYPPDRVAEYSMDYLYAVQVYAQSGTVLNISVCANGTETSPGEVTESISTTPATTGLYSYILEGPFKPNASNYIWIVVQTPYMYMTANANYPYQSDLVNYDGSGWESYGQDWIIRFGWSYSGHTEIYNGTGTYFVDAVDTIGDTYRYTFYSYNTTTGMYSEGIATNYTTMGYPEVQLLNLSDVTETSAVMNGLLVDTGDEGVSCTTHFEWGETTSYGNVTDSRKINESENFNETLNNLSVGALYYYRAVTNNSVYTSYDESVLITKPTPPSNFTAIFFETTPEGQKVNLSWTKGIGQDDLFSTRIERNSHETWDVGEGIFVSSVAGSSSQSYQDTVESNVTIYYQIWSRVGTLSFERYSDYVSTDVTTPLGYPIVTTGGATNIEETSATLNGYLTSTGKASGGEPDPLEYAKTLVELGGATWDGYDKYAHSALKEMYAEGYPFYYVSLVTDENTKAEQRCITDYNLYGYPTVWFDGGYEVVIGGWSGAKAEYINRINLCANRTVKDVDIDLVATWLGGTNMKIDVTITNNEATTYGGHLRVYITEIVSSMGWHDTAGQLYTFPFLDYAFNTPISIDTGETYSNSTTWDGTSNGFPSINNSNIMIIATVFNDEWHQGYSYPPSGYPFSAYYTDKTVATTPSGGANCTTYFEWGRTLEYGNVTDYQTTDEYSYFYETIDGLSPGMLYYCRAVASNDNYTAYGDDFPFFTNPIAPADAIAIAETTPNGSWINLSWTAGIGEEEYLYYTVERNDHEGWSWGDGTQIAYMINDTYFIDTDISPNSTYYYQIWADSFAPYLGGSLSNSYGSANVTTGILYPLVETYCSTPINDTTVVINGYLNSTGIEPILTGGEDVIWEDNFDSYANDQFLNGGEDDGGWKGWNDNPSAGSYVRDDQPLSSPYSIEIAGNSDTVHEYTGCTEGQLSYRIWQYIPTDFSGTSYIILLSNYEISGASNIWGVQLSFNSDTGKVVSEYANEELTYTVGEWKEIRCEIDLDGDWLEIYYDDILLADHTWSDTVNYGGGGAMSLEAVDLFGNGASPIYYDDMSLASVGSLLSNCTTYFEWGTTTSYGNVTANQTTIVTEYFNETLVDLTPETLYHYRAVADNGVYQNYGEDKTFNTPRGNQIPQIEKRYPINNSIIYPNTNLSVTVTDADNDLMNISFYIVNYTGQTRTTTLLTTLYNVTNGSNACINILNYLNMNLDTDYIWYITINDTYGAELTSEEWVFHTSNNIYEPQVSNPYPPHNSETGKDIWLKTDMYDQDGNDLDVSFYLIEGLNEFFIKTVNVESGGQAQVHLSMEYPIQANITYQWYVIVNDSSHSIVSPSWTFHTTSPVFTNIQVSPKTQTVNGNVNITCNVNDTVPITTVKVNIVGPSGFTPINVSMNDQYYLNMSYAISGTYTYFIWAKNVYNISSRSGNDNFWVVSQIITEPLSEGQNTINTTEETDTNISINVTRTTNITLIRYEENPHPESTPPPDDIYIFINVTVEDETAVVWPINITLFYTQQDLDNINLTEDQLAGLYFWNSTAEQWQLYNKTGVNTSYNSSGYVGYCWAEAWHLTTIIIGCWNQPPYTPTNPSPVEGASDLSIDTNFGWICTDPNRADRLTYDIYFGSSPSPPKIVNKQSGYTYDPGILGFETTYYWRIVAWDSYGASAEGPLWSFTTKENTPPSIPSNPTPVHTATEVELNTDLYWIGNDPDGDVMTYDVYFGINNPPSLIRSNYQYSSFDLETLAYEKTYYWKIISRDIFGKSTEGPVWSFTTKINNPPTVPNNPSPTDTSTNININADLGWSCSDPDGHQLTYDIYFGTYNPPALIKSKHHLSSYALDVLLYDTTYYWKIVAHDAFGKSTEGPVWRFTTQPNLPPNTPSNPAPTNAAIHVDLNTDLQWTCTDPEGDPLIYDVFFGTTNTPPLVSHNQLTTIYTPGSLNFITTYYWKIIAYDSFGKSTVGPVWSFTTKPSNLAPVANAGDAYIGNEGSAITFDASASSDPDGDLLEYRWDFNNDGIWDTPYSTETTATFTWYNDYAGIVTVEVFDGIYTTIDSTTITVNNVAPTATLDNDGPKNEGSVVTMSFTNQYDPGTSDTFMYSFDWNNDGIYEIVDQTGTSATHTWYDDGAYTVKGKIIDNDGGFTDYLTTVMVNNVAPTATLGNDGPKNEGSVVTVSFTNQYDPGTSDTFMYSFDWNNDGIYEIVDQTDASATYTWYDNDNGAYTVKGRIVDDDDGFTEYTTAVTVYNVPPVITSLNCTNYPIQAGTSSTLIGTFTDFGWSDTFIATINWGDGNSTTGSITGSNGNYTVSSSWTYTQAGVYMVILTVEDDNGGSDSEEFQYVVVYNPEGGFVTGGGWFMSPAGAYPSYPNLTGKANFGFVSKYLPGQHIPTGNTEFQLKVADLNFHSNEYEWLVVAGKKAMYKGNGTINNQGNYEFRISAIDGNLQGGDGKDKFRIKIWDKDNQNIVIYDNMIGYDENSDPTTMIGGGNIIIHKN